MLLDLNVPVVSSDSVCHVTRSAMELEKKFFDEDSSSSLLSTEDVRQNDAERNSCASNTSLLIFDILKVQNPAPEYVTRQLFPATVSSTSAKARWFNNLSFVDKNGQAELSIVQHKQLLRKNRRGPKSRSSQYRGVTFYRRTGRWESHIWESGKQVYLGGFDSAYDAARAYDQAAIKFRGVDANINFSLGDYAEAMKQTQNLSKEEFVQRLRRRRAVFPGKSSKCHGVALQKRGPWEAHTGQFLGNKENDTATLPCNIREAATNSGPSARQANIVIHANTGGNFYNLDLSLGIGMSSPSNAQKGNVNANDFHFQCGEMPAKVGKMIECSIVRFRSLLSSTPELRLCAMKNTHSLYTCAIYVEKENLLYKVKCSQCIRKFVTQLL